MCIEVAVSAANRDTPSNPKGPMFLALCFAARDLERLTPLEVFVEPAAKRGVQKRRRRRVAWRGERQRRPLPPKNHDSAQAGGPYATKAIFQEEGSGHHGGHDQQ